MTLAMIDPKLISLVTTKLKAWWQRIFGVAQEQKHMGFSVANDEHRCLEKEGSKPMAKNSPKPKKPDEPPDKEEPFQEFGGSRVDDWNKVLVDQALQALWTGNSPDDKLECQRTATAAALKGVGPKDELESMFAAQLIAAHNATMECFRRSMLKKQTFEGRREALNQANKLARTFATTVGALDKHRGRAQQKMTVEHVHVYAGGQAVVGTIEQKEGGASFLEDQPHAKQITYAFEPSMWGEDACGDSVPIPSNGEWSLSYAWWEIDGSTAE